MKSTNRKRALLVSCAVILLCMMIIVGMTFALFTDTRKVKNHLQAGNMEITLKRTNLVKTTLNAEGYLEELDPVTTTVNFSSSTGENVFGINANEKIVPGSKFVATMQIENHSDVAFGYWIEIVCTDQTDGADLAKQLKVTVNTGEDKSAAVGDGLVVKGDNNGYVGELAIGKTETFTVTVEFEDKDFSLTNGVLSSDNNAAKKQALDFDLVVYAVQVTEAPVTP